MQVKLSGNTQESRYVVTCNGRRVPLQSRGVPGEAVAGVRYRARRLSATSTSHNPGARAARLRHNRPWSERSIGRCTYHTGSPDGRVYTTRPLNATEAEQRHMERFQESEPSPGQVAVPEECSQSDVSYDSGSAISPPRTRSPRRNAWDRAMTA